MSRIIRKPRRKKKQPVRLLIVNTAIPTQKNINNIRPQQRFYQINYHRDMLTNRAQTFVEYLLVISVVTAIMIAMSTMLRRSVQGLVKVVSDQVGLQQNAEQDSAGQIVRMNTGVQRGQRVNVREYQGNTTYTYETDYMATQVDFVTNSGYIAK